MVRSPAFEPGANVAVLGLGISGVAAARLALARGGCVYASDVSDGDEQVSAAEALRSTGIDAEAGGHDMERILAADIAVVSPGIGPATPVRSELIEAGVRNIAEIELAYRDLTSRIIGITGTNGKTTVSQLLTHVLKTSGTSVECAGNVGLPLSEIALREQQPDWIVAELSSFQLADLEQFRSDVGVLLNLGPDHLDRYHGIAPYYRDKQQLFERSTEESNWILNADDPDVLNMAQEAQGTQFLFSIEGPVEAGAWLEDGDLIVRLADGQRTWMPVSELPLPGGHSAANALAAGLAAACVGCSDEDIRSGLQTFQGLTHRLQTVVDRDGVLWIDDSKATNLSATHAALQAFGRPVVLLLGGRHKGSPFSVISALVRQKTRAVIAFGESAPLIVQELGESTPTMRVESGMDSVVRAAAQLAQPGDVVLLSPACSSHDMFRSYKERGKAFQRCVEQLGSNGAGRS